jgi:predicted  nucleic acid-binding Zn-ribbon protein
MGQRIDQFCENLRQKLTMTDSGLDGLKAKIDGKATHVEQDVQSHLERVNKRIEQGRAKVSAAQADMKNWAEQRKAVTKEKIAEWKAKRELSKLQGRADDAETYAAAAIDVAVAAVDEAEQASLEAWLARQDADNTQSKQAAAV